MGSTRGWSISSRSIRQYHTPVQLSDDSDIEGHPNIDKKSLIRFVHNVPRNIDNSIFSTCSYPFRWKQRDIHEKREARNHQIEELQAEVDCNDVLLSRLRAFQPQLAQSGSSRFSSEVERLRANPSPEAPRTNAPRPVPYDEMVLRLLETIAKEARERAGSDQDKLEGLLEEQLDFHVKKLSDVTEERRKEMEALLKEKAKHITMEDIHDGFESKVDATFIFFFSYLSSWTALLSSMFLQSQNLLQLVARERKRALLKPLISRRSIRKLPQLRHPKNPLPMLTRHSHK